MFSLASMPGQKKGLTPYKDLYIGPPRTPIRRFLYYGAVYRFTDNDDYSIDKRLRVYKNGKRIATAAFTASLVYRGVRTTFNTIRLYLAVVHPLEPDVERQTGIRTVDPSLRVSDAGRYAYETPQDRIDFFRKQQDALDALDVESWPKVEYNGHVFNGCQTSTKTGAFRNARTRRPIAVSPLGRVKLTRSNGPSVVALAHRAWMQTCGPPARDGQTVVDRVNGKVSDPRPANFRWASPSESSLYKF